MSQSAPKQGVQLDLYCRVRARHDDMLLSEWLFGKAKKQDIGGRSVFRAIACYGRHGVLHEARFFALADNLAVKVELLVFGAQADQLLQRVNDAGVDLAYARSAISFGISGIT